jgi:hypothetical protein
MAAQRRSSIISLLFFSVLHSCAIGCPQGLLFYWGDDDVRVFSTAYADSGSLSGGHTPKFVGSFVARVTESHTFQLWCDLYDISDGYPAETRFIFEGASQDGVDTWTQARTLTRDYRYPITFHTTDWFTWVKISIGVSFPGRDMANLNGDLIGTCETRGCRDTALGRSPYDCRPSPSSSPTRAFLPSSPVPFSGAFPGPPGSRAFPASGILPTSPLQRSPVLPLRSPILRPPRKGGRPSPFARA